MLISARRRILIYIYYWFCVCVCVQVVLETKKHLIDFARASVAVGSIGCVQPRPLSQSGDVFLFNIIRAQGPSYTKTAAPTPRRIRTTKKKERPFAHRRSTPAKCATKVFVSLTHYICHSGSPGALFAGAFVHKYNPVNAIDDKHTRRATFAPRVAGFVRQFPGNTYIAHLSHTQPEMILASLRAVLSKHFASTISTPPPNHPAQTQRESVRFSLV